MRTAVVWIVAHQGGWDELLMFGIPIILAVLAVRWAERRRAGAEDRDGDGEGRPDSPD